jgi:hypothetical protein
MGGTRHGVVTAGYLLFNEESVLLGYQTGGGFSAIDWRLRDPKANVQETKR